MRSDASGALIGGRFDYPSLAPAGLMCRVEIGEASPWQAEKALKNVQDRVVDRHRLPDEWSHSVLHPRVDGWRVRPMDRTRPRERIVLCDVQELDCVPGAIQVCGDCPSCFVAETTSQRCIYWGSGE